MLMRSIRVPSFDSNRSNLWSTRSNRLSMTSNCWSMDSIRRSTESNRRSMESNCWSVPSNRRLMETSCWSMESNRRSFASNRWSIPSNRTSRRRMSSLVAICIQSKGGKESIRSSATSSPSCSPSEARMRNRRCSREVIVVTSVHEGKGESRKCSQCGKTAVPAVIRSHAGTLACVPTAVEGVVVLVAHQREGVLPMCDSPYDIRDENVRDLGPQF